MALFRTFKIRKSPKPTDNLFVILFFQSFHFYMFQYLTHFIISSIINLLKQFYLCSNNKSAAQSFFKAPETAKHPPVVNHTRKELNSVDSSLLDFKQSIQKKTFRNAKLSSTFKFNSFTNRWKPYQLSRASRSQLKTILSFKLPIKNPKQFYI
jgi:hypothetical protein